jgi:LuxR family transcriptional regulator, maltose regulon positive regulatory protein
MSDPGRHGGDRGLLGAVPASASITPGVPTETKLYAPSLRKEWVERPELVSYLAGTAAKLVVVEAPAGFGKTTLVAQWRASPMEKRRFAWLSLDIGDDDPGRLWPHVAHSLQRACPELDGDEILRALRRQSPDMIGVALPTLVNELAALQAPVVLVLDDYHVIKERSCHEQTAFLLLHLPQSAEIVLISRADPALPVARLRAAGEMLELRAPELRFVPAEAAALVRNVAGVEFSDPDLAVLLERTEGWPAGLYLAALSLRGHPSPGDFIRQFSGDNRFIVDFLAEEVLSRQPSEIRQFLARTAILGRFCAPLCNAVAGSAGSAGIIDTLERENLFVVALDDTREWFRYHNLFARVLRSELTRSEPEIVPVLHQRASDWHRLYGSADEAINHALAAGDVAGVIDLIARNWFALIDSGRVATVRRWMNSLGDGMVSARPVAAHYAAWAAALSGDPESLRRWLHIIEAAECDGSLPDGVHSMQSSAALLKATFGFEGIETVRDAAAKAVALETDPASPWQAVARASYATALYWSGDLTAAAAQAQGALASPASAGLGRMLAFAILSLMQADDGNLAQAEQLALSALEIVADADPGLREAPQSALAFAAVGAVLARRGRLTDARLELEHALRLRRRQVGISPWATMEILLRLAPLLLDIGDRPGAAALFGEARNILTSLPDGAEAQLTRLERLEQRVATRQSRTIPLAASLTTREVVVLRLLRGTLSLGEIGRELQLSQNTIKTHTQAIYRKLSVSTRHSAVAKGHEIGIS